jgi:hypothetical protein
MYASGLKVFRQACVMSGGEWEWDSGRCVYLVSERV